ncbi:vacuolar protein sorting-associated protein 53 homolog [Phymastichus coffea]|uniref:vacuolar protein sorting-associated protein 53 homolog n=1 Tax=Phymastichus coffea TaxID=108790 RepID=UPI00273B9B81|nr:vacuolar protein sorting-associated protein 53 homolog [Phymastichus coffea]XP_058806704.1 vacuolar protein sorting-associated protein 53 homolog [Phymastichus coffea]
MSESEKEHSDDAQTNIYNFPPSVQAVIEKVFPSNDPLDQPDFNEVDYINTLFPTEQSLSNIDDVINKMESEMAYIDKEIRAAVRSQTSNTQDGKTALEDAQKSIRQLFAQIKDIKAKAEESEETVKEITRDIKQLDFAKKNLTASITTLNHLHMLVDGVQTLKNLTAKKQYGEIILPLQATMEVMQHFNCYMDIPQVKELSDEVHQIHIELAQQITTDFKEAFSGQNPKYFAQLTEGCLVLSVLDPKVKKELLSWFVTMQLQEYTHLFDENQEFAWLDKIDRRYAWIKKHLLEFESKFGHIFPRDWEVSERIAVQFCHITREDLSKLMHKRTAEIDVKLLLFAIQRTSNFESLLAKRFTGITLEDHSKQDKKQKKFEAGALSVVGTTASATTTDNVPGNPFEEENIDKGELEKPATSPFNNLIGKCFESYLYIYIESLDRNLAELIEKFVADYKAQPPGAQAYGTGEAASSVLSSCADLFVFYRKCMIQCTQLSSGAIMLNLAETFQKYLRDYALKILQNNLPKIGGVSLGSSVSSITREFRDLSTSGFIQNFSSFLKEGETSKFSREEQARICCILTTAEYCLETTQQLEEKLRLKTDKIYADKINLSQEQDTFHGVISNCIQLLVQDLELACEPSLNAMIKIPWSTLESVGDQSSYVSTIVAYLRQTIPVIRDQLSSCRKYFTQLCIKFVTSFIPKLTQQIFKCKPLNTVGAEQLLLDVHMLKTAILDLPCIGSQMQRKAPATYTKVVIKGMTTAEMILKIVMSPTESASGFVDQCKKLLPDLKVPEFQKILDMKGLRKTEQVQLMEEFKQRLSLDSSNDQASNVVLESPEHEAGRIKRLEKLIKKRM